MNYNPGDQFIFESKTVRIVACRRLTREGYVIRFFEDGGMYGMYILSKERIEPAGDIPEDRRIVKTLSEIGELSEEQRQMIKNAAEWPIIFDYDCPHMPVDNENEIEVDFEKAKLKTPHEFDDFDRRIRSCCESEKE